MLLRLSAVATLTSGESGWTFEVLTWMTEVLSVEGSGAYVICVAGGSDVCVVVVVEEVMVVVVDDVEGLVVVDEVVDEVVEEVAVVVDVVSEVVSDVVAEGSIVVVLPSVVDVVVGAS